jgi:sigma-B regulation protein RsbU (phosphoserine phosphatase)
VLQIVMRELRAASGAVFGRDEDGGLALWASRGLPPGAPPTLGVPPRAELCVLGPGDEAHDRHGLELLAPIVRRDRVIAVLGLGGREGGRELGVEEQAFLRAVAECVAAPIENGLLHGELRRAHQKLSVKAFELHSLFDVSRDLTGGFPEQAIQDLVITTVMGHFLVSRCALYLCGPQGLSLVRERGLRRDLESAPIPAAEVEAALRDPRPRAVVELPPGPLRRWLSEARLALAVPLVAGERVEGVLAIGERASGMPFSPEDSELAQALARQAWAALENARLQQVREAKQRQDRELQIAREIQQSLFPPQPPELTGFEVAGESRPCYEVGGDSYDWIPLGRDRIALVVADVAGKGTPASLLMASAHAFVHALAGTLAPDQVIERLNRFLFARTHAGRFVTLFYAELDTAERRLAYVNAGHVPPFLVARGGAVSRLSDGGAALGLLPEEAYAVGEVTLAPGDVLAIVTDGVTEAMSPEEHELGDDRVCAALRRLSGGSATATLAGLVAAVDEWAGGRGRSDDLTALILKAR